MLPNDKTNQGASTRNDQATNPNDQATSPQTLQAITPSQVMRWHKGNDVWAMAVVEQPTDMTTPTPPAQVQALLSKYQHLFQEPKELPPHRSFDHTIPLLPNSPPVHSRPYRYSPLQKDEIEKQVTEMLQAGTVIPSMSAFASPVLLVKKKDGTWRFCVDYRHLNALTVKNQFPLPIVDELLDELAGTKYFSKLDQGLHMYTPGTGSI
jgi:hypothetical protein